MLASDVDDNDDDVCGVSGKGLKCVNGVFVATIKTELVDDIVDVDAIDRREVL